MQLFSIFKISPRNGICLVLILGRGVVTGIIKAVCKLCVISLETHLPDGLTSVLAVLCLQNFTFNTIVHQVFILGRDVNTRMFRTVCKVCGASLETKSLDNNSNVKQKVMKRNSKPLFSCYSKAKA
jgi:hypothetical protein